MSRFGVRRGDRVRVISGKFRGREGEVLKVFPKKNGVLISGINLVKRHLKPGKGQAGGIVELEKPVAVPKVAVVCKSCQKTARMGRGFKEGKKVRICKHCSGVL